MAIYEGSPPVIFGLLYKVEIIRNFDDFFGESLNNLLNKQPYCQWFETLWRTCCVILMWNLIKTILYEYLITLSGTKNEMKYSHGIDVMCIIKKLSHDDIIEWKHFPRYWPFVGGTSPVPAEFPAQRPVMLSFDVFFDLRLNKRLNKQSWGWWFETLSRPLWRQCNAVSASIPIFHAVIMGMSENYMYNFHHIRVDRLRVNRLNIVLDEY